MRQVWIPKIGPPEVLEVRSSPDPEVKPTEVRIRVHASGINFADILARMGLYPDSPKLPTVVGYEVAGVVDQVGAEVSTGVAEGDRVVALTRFGGYSDVVTVSAEQVVVLPPEISFEQAAAIPVNYLTAWLMLIWLGNVRASDTVLVHAVAGGVGQAATQICLWRGATVIGTASAGKHPRLKEAGVAHAIDYHTKNFKEEVKRITEGRGVDLVLDAVGGDSFQKSYDCLAPLGRLFVYGVSSLAPKKSRSVVAALKGLWKMPAFRPIGLMNRNRGVLGVNVGHLWRQAPMLQKMLAEISGLVRDGTFSPVVDRTFSLEEAPKAHAYLQDRKNFGKVLLVP